MMGMSADAGDIAADFGSGICVVVGGEDGWECWRCGGGG